VRKLTWAAVGYTAAALLAEYVLPIRALPFLAAAFVLFGALTLLPKGWKRRFCAGILLFGCAVGMLSWYVHYERHAAPCEALVGQEITVTACVTDWPEEKKDYDRLQVRILDGAPKERAVLYSYHAAFPEVTPGDILQAEIRVTSALGAGEERLHWFTAEGQFLRGYVQEEPVVTGRDNREWLYIPQNIAHEVKRLCALIFSEDTAPFLAAILTGNTEMLQENTDQYSDMRTAGVLHMVAVSGMHLLVLVSLLQIAFGRSRWTSILCFPVMVLFVLIAGCRPSIIRAAVMQSVLLLAPLVRRERDGVTGIAAAMLMLLIPNPMAIGSVGLQLSFACVIGFEALRPGMRKWMGLHLPMENFAFRAVGKNVSATICALAFSTPIAALHFGTIPVLAVLSNLLTIWVVSACFALSGILCVLGAFAPGVVSALAFLPDWGVRWCLWVFDWVAKIPFASLYTEQALAVWWLAGVYAVWIGWYLLRRKRIRIVAVVPVCLCVIGLCTVILSGGVSLRNGKGEVTVLNVGQGQCVLLADERSAVLVDCGGNGAADAGDTAANYLLASGKKQVDLLVLTHLHDDHTNGVETLLSRVPVETIILPESADDEDDVLEDLTALAELYDTQLVLLSRPCLARIGGMELSLYLPQAGTDINERGIVVSAEVADAEVLIMGDAGSDAELILLREGCLPDADILVVGHHGSKTSSGRLFLDAVEAELAVISVGNNRYGHPAEEILETLEEYCDLVRRTDLEGTVTIQVSEEVYGESREKSLPIQRRSEASPGGGASAPLYAPGRGGFSA